MKLFTAVKRQIPNLITLGNLTFGVVACYHAALGSLREAAVCIMAGIFLDFFDGLAARLLKVASPVGKELDSLADVVTSGVAPALILFHIIGMLSAGTKTQSPLKKFSMQSSPKSTPQPSTQRSAWKLFSPVRKSAYLRFSVFRRSRSTWK